LKWDFCFPGSQRADGLPCTPWSYKHRLTGL
jgi:hypothetical protein